MIDIVEPKVTDRERKIAEQNLRLLHANDSNHRKEFIDNHLVV